MCLQHVLGAGPQLSCSNADDSWQQMELDAGDPADSSSQRLHLNVKVVICQAALPEMLGSLPYLVGSLCVIGQRHSEVLVVSCRQQSSSVLKSKVLCGHLQSSTCTATSADACPAEADRSCASHPFLASCSAAPERSAFAPHSLPFPALLSPLHHQQHGPGAFSVAL